MITSSEFKEKWEADLSEYEEGLMTAKKDCPLLNSLPEELKVFLLSTGLPHGAAPFLSFDSIGREGLVYIFDVWGVPSNYSEDERTRLSQYYILGSDGAGNPIAIDVSNNYNIVLLDHEDSFKTIKFINSTLFQMAEFLLLVRGMMSKAGDEIDEGGLDNEIPSSYKNKLFTALEIVDYVACQENKFWRVEVGGL